MFLIQKSFLIIWEHFIRYRGITMMVIHQPEGSFCAMQNFFYRESERCVVIHHLEMHAKYTLFYDCRLEPLFLGRGTNVDQIDPDPDRDINLFLRQPRNVFITSKKRNFMAIRKPLPPFLFERNRGILKNPKREIVAFYYIESYMAIGWW
jgi:hypothetical protein